MKWLIPLVLLIVLISGCVTQECGDGICSVDESHQTCPQDCPEIPTEQINDYLLMFRNDCQMGFQFKEGEIAAEFQGNVFSYAIVEMTEERSRLLNADDCVNAVWTPEEAKEVYENLPPELKAKARDIVKDLNLKRTLEDDIPEEPGDLINNHQTFVTPDDPAVQEVTRRAEGNKEVYKISVQWMWVSERTLNNKYELWLKPNEFLEDTPTYPRNPVPGRVASDCEEQANTLASVLRAEGMAPDKVRVVLGEVNFSGDVGGHAWVEVYEDGEWFQLEASSGPYWDDVKQRLVQSNGVAYGYYKFFEYPIVEVWSYHNDYYFYNPRNGRGNPPELWLE